MAEEEVIAVPSVDNSGDATATNTNNNLQFVLKRKLEDLDEPPSAADADSSELDGDAEKLLNDAAADEPSKRPRLDEQASENGHKAEGDNGHTEENDQPGADVENAEAGDGVTDAVTTVGDGADCDESAKEALPEEENEPQQVSEVEQKDGALNGNFEGTDTQMITPGEAEEENLPKTPGDEGPVSEVAAEGDSASAGQHPESGSKSASKKIEIPNNKVGVLIGKSGDTIKYLQINSGAKIQITRDADADPCAPTRTVELVGAPESLNKAEKLIRDVIAEADAGGSPSLVARGFTAAMSAGSTEVEIPVPGDKVGLIIGRGGDTIRNLQTKSGARIQLIPQNIPGEQGKEKKVKITGDKKQVEAARELIKEVMNQLPGRPSQFSGSNFGQQNYRPHGPGGAPQWGNRGPPSQPMPYDYHQRGPYPSQSQQYPAQSYGNYPYQGPPRSNFGSGWEHRPQVQGPPHSGGHDFYGHASGPHSAHMPGHASGPSMAPPPHSQGNYNYGQPRGADYTQSTPYSQTAPPAQNYGHGYGDPKYDAQAPVQQPYGGHGYAPPQQGYAPQQQYNRPPPYGMPSQGAPQGYAPPAASQPAETPYQASVSAAQPYNPNIQPHQQYPYAPGPTTQPPYGSAPVTSDAYAQPQQAAGYAQQGAQPVPGYAQQAGGYAQTAAPTAGYGQYPQTAQPGYGDQTAAAAATSAAAYGYQGQVDPSAYAAGQAYSAAPAPLAQPGYAQPVATQPGYDQSAPQTGAYAGPAAAAAAPAAYGKTVSPQPGYPPQYDASQQMYAAPR